MKEWKSGIVSAIVREAETDKIISLREIANRLGITHITQHDCMDIVIAIGKQLAGYRPVRMMHTEHDSLFTSVCFVDRELEFDGEEV